MAVQLHQPGRLSRGFHLHKGKAPARQEDQPVRHFCRSGRDPFRADAARRLHSFDEFLFHLFFPHPRFPPPGVPVSDSQNQKVPWKEINKISPKGDLYSDRLRPAHIKITVAHPGASGPGYDSFDHDVAALTAFKLGLTSHEGMGTIQSDLKHFTIPDLRERMHQYLRTGDASVSPVR